MMHRHFRRVTTADRAQPGTFILVLSGIAALAPVARPDATAFGADTTCATCHPDQARELAGSAHGTASITCVDCHGGAESYDVDPAQLAGTAFDHGPLFAGEVRRLDIPDKCGGCHSDVALMNPYGLPADQLQRYKTSGHGLAVYQRQNTDAAVCTDCHDVHAIYKSSDSRSWTHPLNVPTMCGSCHGDPEMMAKYSHSHEIMAEYQDSVHGRGLLEDHDTAMPTCATCHGNHAAMPPGINNINAVCGRCHMQSEKFFLESPHAQVDSFPKCVACHGRAHGHGAARLTVTPQALVDKYATLQATLEGDDLVEALHPGLLVIKDTCYECHDEDSDDEVDIAALQRSTRLFDMISQSEESYARTHERVHEVGRGVLLVEDEQLLLGDAHTALIELGSRQHSLSTDTVGEATERALTTTKTINDALDRKEDGLAWRHDILWPMWIFIVVFGVASYVKYRRLHAQYVRQVDPS